MRIPICFKVGGRWATAALLAFAAAAPAESLAAGPSDWLDQVDDTLRLSSPSGAFTAKLTGLADLEAYTIDQRPPAILFSHGDLMVNPRLSLYLDTKLGPHFSSLVQARIDRGFDPNVKGKADARFDEYLLRYTPLDDGRVNLQIGKFATVVGNWIERHDSWRNPFINAPLPYENILTVADVRLPASPAAFLSLRNFPDFKGAWLPLIWGPSYAAGASLFGLVDRFEYAAEIKNASLSSRPNEWDPGRTGWENPTYSARIGFRPDASWRLGLSGSYGTYLRPAAAPNLPAGQNLGDYNQVTLGQDLAYSWRHLELWAEVFAARFQIPNVGNADSLSYYVEGKYELNPHWFVAERWNQQLFGAVNDGSGGVASWEKETWRIDSALGYRLDRHWQTKLEYSFTHQNGPIQQGEQLLAMQLTLKF